jgi:hypothetical protein
MGAGAPELIARWQYAQQFKPLDQPTDLIQNERRRDFARASHLLIVLVIAEPENVSSLVLNSFAELVPAFTKDDIPPSLSKIPLHPCGFMDCVLDSLHEAITGEYMTELCNEIIYVLGRAPPLIAALTAIP